MKLVEKCQKLESYPTHSSERFLTVYLNTAPTGNQPQQWKIRLKNGMKKLIEYSKAAGDDKQVRQLLNIQKQIEAELDNRRQEFKNGLVIVAEDSGVLLFFESLQAPLPNRFYWEKEPRLQELKELLRRYPAAGIIQVGHDSVAVIDTILGEIKQEVYFEWNADNEDWKEYKGVAATIREASSSSQRERFHDRMDVHRQRWMKRLVPVIERFKKQKQWQELIFTGEKSLASELSREFQPMKTRVISKNMNRVPSHEVIREVYSAGRA
ncbi:VLRF1 family aeRF1-type release factor [Paenibacillus sp. GCM10012307]|uniref:Uncharacterized protein n=1 Tax=Paenibacillus roseus TaxID=2798579 RepID=A0A934J312_9BACL|nr:VLRF1 family aeRF1-type release factor [Paenibacillus roseus]MBJ6362354.1 hypothetical protein [Paenibacillus roseus]